MKLTTLFSLKSIPTVEMNFELKVPSVYWYKKLLFPTPESPRARNLMRKSYSPLAGVVVVPVSPIAMMESVWRRRLWEEMERSWIFDESSDFLQI